jgi:nucleolar protein 58
MKYFAFVSFLIVTNALCIQINGSIIEVTCLVFNCDYSVDRYSQSLHEAAKHLKNISGINSEGWDLLKIATALKMVCCPEDHLTGGAEQVNHSIALKIICSSFDKIVIWVMGQCVFPHIFSEDERKKLLKDAPEYKGKLKPRCVLLVYEDIVWAPETRNKWLGLLPCYLKNAEEAYEAKQVMK